MNRAQVAQGSNVLGMLVAGGVLIDSLSAARGAPPIYVMALVTFGVTHRALGTRPGWLRFAFFTNSGLGLLLTLLGGSMLSNHEARGIEGAELATFFGASLLFFVLVVMNLIRLMKTALKARAAASEAAPAESAEGDAAPLPGAVADARPAADDAANSGPTSGDERDR